MSAVAERCPAGWELTFSEEPYRHYKIDGEEVPSVTTVLGCLDKPGLPWWGMKTGAENVAALVLKALGDDDTERVYEILADPVDALKKAKLTVNHVRDSAGTRGSQAHEWMEAFVGDGILPPEDGSYGSALLAWFADAQPEIQDAEVIVGSTFYGFAGRYDLRVWQPERELVVNAKTGKRRVFPEGIYRVDAKTSKGVYGSHLLQLDLYEVGAIEAGYSGTDGQYVLRLGADGKYEAVRNKLPLGTAVPIVEVARAVKLADDSVKARAR